MSHSVIKSGDFLCVFKNVGFLLPTNFSFILDLNVFTDKNEAFKILKSHKEARLKVFKTYNDALQFAKIGFEVCPINTNVIGLKCK